MSVLYWLSGAVSIVLFVYLVYALLKAEEF